VASVLTKKLSPLWIAVPLIGFLVWKECGPLPWAADLAREEVNTCYAERCLDLRQTEEQYGAARSHQIIAVKRGILNNYYSVIVDAERERGRTRETFALIAGYASRLEKRFASIQEVSVQRR